MNDNWERIQSFCCLQRQLDERLRLGFLTFQLTSIHRRQWVFNPIWCVNSYHWIRCFNSSWGVWILQLLKVLPWFTSKASPLKSSVKRPYPTHALLWQYWTSNHHRGWSLTFENLSPWLHRITLYLALHNTIRVLSIPFPGGSTTKMSFFFWAAMETLQVQCLLALSSLSLFGFQPKPFYNSIALLFYDSIAQSCL